MKSKLNILMSVPNLNEREDIKYTDNLELVINLINNTIKIKF